MRLHAHRLLHRPAGPSDRKYGVTHCANDNGHHDWFVDMSPYTSDKAGKVRVTLEHHLSQRADWAGVESVSP